jgi:hypothetical protein
VDFKDTLFKEVKISHFKVYIRIIIMRHECKRGTVWGGSVRGERKEYWG